MSVPKGDVFLAGVGGQGTLLASEVLCDAFLLSGFDVKKSEVHGMAQRGGSVTTICDSVRKSSRLSSSREGGPADRLREDRGAPVSPTTCGPAAAMVVKRPGDPPAVRGHRAGAVPAGCHRAPAGRHGSAPHGRRPRRCVVDARGARGQHRAGGGRLPLPSASEAAYEEAMKARLPEKIVDVNVRAFRAGRRCCSRLTVKAH